MEDDTPVIYFYRLIETFDDESAQGFYDVIIHKIQEEKANLLGYFKRNLVGFASDGAAVKWINSPFA